MMKRLVALLTVFLGLQFFVFADENDTPTYIPTIIVVEDDSDVETLRNQGVVIWRQRGDMLLALIPSGMQMPARAKGRIRTERSRRAVLAMDKARTYFDAEKIYTGEGLTRPYSGEGVVAGLCDIGVDPHHIAFQNPDGTSRVKKIVYYDEVHGIRKVVDTPEGIAEWTTDDPDQYHGTHVANIMAGSYRGNNYQGMAPGADLVVTHCQLYDVGILAACEDIIDYAKSVGKPCVINLSLSNYNGPRDGTSLFCRYMDLLGEEAVVLLAAGNAGSSNVGKRVEFTEAKPRWRTKVGSSDWVQFTVMGYTDAWSADTKPVGFRLLVHDDYTGQAVYEGEELPATGPYSYRLSSDTDAEFAQYVSGEVQVEGYVSELNNRWVTEISYDTSCSISNPTNAGWARYRIAFEFTGNPGTKADITADCQYSKLDTYGGYGATGSELSISDMCTGYNTIGVGMYTSRSSMPEDAQDDNPNSDIAGRVNPYSSYGTLMDGRIMPHTVAPGSIIVSACNGQLIKKYPDATSWMAAESEVDGEKYYWVNCAGTSMASPYAAGVIATWLEADPTLDVHGVQKVIKDTNFLEMPNPSNPKNGQGFLQPYEGLKQVVLTTQMSTGTIDSAKPVVVINGDKAEVLNPGGNPLDIEIFAMNGMTVMKRKIANERVAQIDIADLPKGIYLLRIGNSASSNVKFIR